MPKPNKAVCHISREQASSSQQAIVEILDESIERERNNAFSKSPEMRYKDNDVLFFPNLPKQLMKEVEKAGLMKEFENVPKCEYQPPKTGDKLQHILRWIYRHGKPMPHQGQQMQPMTV